MTITERQRYALEHPLTLEKAAMMRSGKAIPDEYRVYLPFTKKLHLSTMLTIDNVGANGALAWHASAHVVDLARKVVKVPESLTPVARERVIAAVKELLDGVGVGDPVPVGDEFVFHFYKPLTTDEKDRCVPSSEPTRTQGH